MHINHIRRLARWMAEAGLTGLELRESGFELRLARSGQAMPTLLPDTAQASPPASAPGETLSRPLIAAMATRCGYFHARHPARDRAQVSAGQAVAVGDAVGVITVGTLLLPVLATHAGIAGEYLVEDGQRVEYATPLLALAGE